MSALFFSERTVQETGTFKWRTKEGQEIRVTRMETRHIFYSLRMLFNHTVPSGLEIPGCREYRGPRDWSIAYKRQAVGALITELSTRKDIRSEWMDQLKYMQETCTRLDKLALT